MPLSTAVHTGLAATPVDRDSLSKIRRSVGRPKSTTSRQPQQTWLWDRTL